MFARVDAIVVRESLGRSPELPGDCRFHPGKGDGMGIEVLYSRTLTASFSLHIYLILPLTFGILQRKVDSRPFQLRRQAPSRVARREQVLEMMAATTQIPCCP